MQCMAVGASVGGGLVFRVMVGDLRCEVSSQCSIPSFDAGWTLIALDLVELRNCFFAVLRLWLYLWFLVTHVRRALLCIPKLFELPCVSLAQQEVYLPSW